MLQLLRGLPPRPFAAGLGQGLGIAPPHPFAAGLGQGLGIARRCLSGVEVIPWLGKLKTAGQAIAYASKINSAISASKGPELLQRLGRVDLALKAVQEVPPAPHDNELAALLQAQVEGLVTEAKQLRVEAEKLHDNAHGSICKSMHDALTKRFDGVRALVADLETGALLATNIALLNGQGDIRWALQQCSRATMICLDADGVAAANRVAAVLSREKVPCTLRPVVVLPDQDMLSALKDTKAFFSVDIAADALSQQRLLDLLSDPATEPALRQLVETRQNYVQDVLRRTEEAKQSDPGKGTESEGEEPSVSEVYARALERCATQLRSVGAVVRHAIVDVPHPHGIALVGDEVVVHSGNRQLLRKQLLTPSRPADPMPCPATEMCVPQGPQLNVNEDMLRHWTKHYDKQYGDETLSLPGVLTAIPDEAEWVFVGARDPEGTIPLGAFGRRDQVLRCTQEDRPHQHHGTFWYSSSASAYSAPKSFGFSDKSNIDQHEMRYGDKADPSSKHRLSWSLKAGVGRAGEVFFGEDDSGDASKWRKLIYYRMPTATVEMPVATVGGLAAEGRSVFLAQPGRLLQRDLDSPGQGWRAIAGTGRVGCSGDDGPALEAQVGYCQWLAATGKDVFFVDTNMHVVRRFHRPTGTVHRVVGVVGVAGEADCIRGKSMMETHLRDPEALAVCGHLLYVADTGNGRVLCCDMKSDKVTTVYAGTAPGPICAATKHVWVYDTHRIFQVDFESKQTRPILGSGHAAFSGEGLSPLATHLNNVTGIVQTESGELLVADKENHVVRAVALPEQMATERSSDAWHMASAPAEVPATGDAASAMMPYHGVQWHSDGRPSVNLLRSPPLRAEKSTVEMKLSKPVGLLSIGLWPAQPPPIHERLDSYLVYKPEWNDSTCVQQTSKLMPKHGPRSWPEWVAHWKTSLSEMILGPEPPLQFGMRNTNHFKVTVSRRYCRKKDLYTWNIDGLWINGIERGEALRPFSAGLDLEVYVGIFADGFNLHMHGPLEVQ